MMAGKSKSGKKMSDYNRFIKKELKGKTGPGYKARFKAAVAKWKRSPKGRASRARAGKPPRRQRRLAGGPPRTRARPRAKPRAKPKSTGGRKMAGFNTQKLMKYIRLAGLVAPAAGIAMSNEPGVTKVWRGIKAYTGFDTATRKFSFADLAEGWMPYLGSIAVTYGIPKIAGIIRGL